MQRSCVLRTSIFSQVMTHSRIYSSFVGVSGIRCWIASHDAVSYLQLATGPGRQLHSSLCRTLHWAKLWDAPDVYFASPPNQQTSHIGRSEERHGVLQEPPPRHSRSPSRQIRLRSRARKGKWRRRRSRSAPRSGEDRPDQSRRDPTAPTTGERDQSRQDPTEPPTVDPGGQLSVPDTDDEFELPMPVPGTAVPGPTLPTQQSLMILLEAAEQAAEKVQGGWPTHVEEFLECLPEASFPERTPTHGSMRLGICICASGELEQLKISLPLLLLILLTYAGYVRVFILIPMGDDALQWLLWCAEAAIRSQLLTVFVTEEKEWDFSRWYNSLCDNAAERGATVVNLVNLRYD